MTADVIRFSGLCRNGRCDVLWTKPLGPVFGALPTLSTTFCAERSRLTSQLNSRPSSIRHKPDYCEGSRPRNPPTVLAPPLGSAVLSLTARWKGGIICPLHE